MHKRKCIPEEILLPLPGQLSAPICWLCTDVLCDPMLVKCCGKSFCAACINDVRCPICQIETEKIPNVDLRSIIENLPVCCITKFVAGGESPNCTWQGSIHELEQHLKACPNVLLPCPFNRFDCGCPLVRRDRWTAHQGHMSAKHAQLAIAAQKVSCQRFETADNSLQNSTIEYRHPGAAVPVGGVPPVASQPRQTSNTPACHAPRVSPRLQQSDKLNLAKKSRMTRTTGSNEWSDGKIGEACEDGKVIATRERSFFQWHCTAVQCHSRHSTRQMPTHDTLCSVCRCSFGVYGVLDLDL
jgi:hypothetical protein